MVKILLIGSGGREHALAWKLAQSNKIERIFVAPGNGGTQRGAKMFNVPIHASSFEGLSKFAQDNGVDLIVVGPEQPLVDGAVEFFKKVGIPAFGPTSKAAIIESSKAFSKDFMKRHGIPTASYETFVDSAKALEYLSSREATSLVFKADGLAAGKGVILPESLEEAKEAISQIMVSKEFGTAGDSLVIEERLDGPEISIFAFSDGYTVTPLLPSQDHKRVGEGDVGLNTGGMGAFCPTSIATKELMNEIKSRVLQPTIDGMRKEGRPFVGLLYAGLLLDKKKGIQVLEYNCRFGDPETQAVLTLLQSDLYEIMLACVEGRLDSVQVNSETSSYAVNVVIASGGYPSNYEKGKVISGLEKLSGREGVTVFHAGTSIDKSGNIVTSGGRVINVVATGKSLEEAIKLANEAASEISFEGSFFRRDIGKKALQGMKEKQNQSVTYREAGVDIDSGNSLVERIKPFTKATARLGSEAVIGGFGGLFDLKPLGYKDPVLVSGTDGVGTKLMIAQKVGAHSTIGIDLVAMSVNDVLAHGAEPLFFLDYFACGKLDVSTAADVIKGIAQGCKESGCALIGGETAEMPGLYAPGEYDLAGFAVAVVERDRMLPKMVQTGDVLIGLPSSGIHSNGYSLVRYLVEKKSGLSYEDAAPFAPSKKLWEVLLAPTKLYVKPVLAAIQTGLNIKAVAHITGGGFTDNIPRVFGDQSVAAHIELDSWPLPPLFKWLQELGNISKEELLRTFNCGIGLVLVVSASDAEGVIESFKNSGEVAYVLGKLQNRENDSEMVYTKEFRS